MKGTVVSSKSIVLTIVAIVGGLALLFKALQVRTMADKLEQTMKGVSAVIDILRDRVLKLVVP
jgi:hypothetical protein